MSLLIGLLSTLALNAGTIFNSIAIMLIAWKVIIPLKNAIYRIERLEHDKYCHKCYMDYPTLGREKIDY